MRPKQNEDLPEISHHGRFSSFDRKRSVNWGANNKLRRSQSNLQRLRAAPFYLPKIRPKTNCKCDGIRRRNIRKTSAQGVVLVGEVASILQTEFMYL